MIMHVAGTLNLDGHAAYRIGSGRAGRAGCMRVMVFVRHDAYTL
jgi:hypothetical protein